MRIIITLLIAISLTSTLFAKLKTEKVSIFKNGTGFFIKSGKIKTKNKKIYLDAPDSTFGTMWVNSKNLFSLKTTDKPRMEKRDVKSILDILKANNNKKCIITLTDNKEIKATILSLGDSIVNLKTDKGWLTLDTKDIKKIIFKDKPNMKHSVSTGKNRVELKFKDNGNKNIDLFYLRKGITWMPNYLIELKGKKKAKLTLKALIINDAEELLKTNVDFVVGVPNFKYSHILSPLGSDMKLKTFLDTLNGRNSRGYYYNNNANRMMNQAVQVRSNRFSSNNDNYAANPFIGVAGTTNEDLFFYHLRDVTIKKGERATYQLLSIDIPIEHIYEVSLSENASSSGYRVSKSYRNYGEKTNEVWHSIKLKNISKSPWTTGTAMIVKKDKRFVKPVAQNMMKYTPVTANAFLKITTSPDIQIVEEDREVKKIRSALKKYGYFYDLVTVKGTIKVKNYKREKIKLEIKKTIMGALKKSNKKWNIIKRFNDYGYSINSTNDVSWNISLKPNEEKVINYNYKIYLSH